MKKENKILIEKIEKGFNYRFRNKKIILALLESFISKETFSNYGHLALQGALSLYMMERYTNLINFKGLSYAHLTSSFDNDSFDPIVKGVLSKETYSIIMKKIGISLDDFKGISLYGETIEDYYERIIGAIALDIFYSNRFKGNYLYEIIKYHLDMVYDQLNLPDDAFNEKNDYSGLYPNIIKRNELFSLKIDDLTKLTSLAEKKKIPPLNFICKEEKNNGDISYKCTLEFPHDTLIEMLCVHQDMDDVYADSNDMTEWNADIFSSSASSNKSFDEAKKLVAHKVINKLKARHKLHFLVDYYDEEGYEIDEPKELYFLDELSMLDKNVEVDETLLEKIDKINNGLLEII